MKIVDLRVGDLVADERSAIGTVVKFTQNHVVIEWEEACGRQSSRYDDRALAADGVVLVEGTR